MALLARFLVHGVSPTPLIGETIGQLLRRVTAEGSDRPALVTRHQNVRWTCRPSAPVRRPGRGLAQTGPRKGRSGRHLVGEEDVSEWVLAQFGTALANHVIIQYRLPKSRI